MSLYKLYFSSGATVIALPINPEKLPETFSADNGTYNVLGLGPIMQPRTPNLRTVSISGLLPGRRLPGQTGIHLPPAVYMAFFTTAIRALDPLLTAINWVANNLDVAIPLVVSLGAAFGVLLIAANWTNILATATKTAASMQAFYNAVMAANPIALAAAAVLVLVAALYGGVAAFNKLTGSSISATGIITGAFTTMGAFILNGTLVPLHNGFAAFVNFLGNAFNDPITAIDVLFYDMSITTLNGVDG